VLDALFRRPSDAGGSASNPDDQRSPRRRA
jgi:hypothetical protein